jgi:drug/metabolite transporter (DMT)-like permease
MSSSQGGRWRLATALIVLSLAWGHTWVLAKQGLACAPPFVFAAQRCVGGALALFLALKLLGRPLHLVAPGKTLGIALVNVAAFLTFQTWALVEGGAGKTAVLSYTMPIWTLLMAWPFLGERIRGVQWLAAACALAGLTLIIGPWSMQASLLSKLGTPVVALLSSRLLLGEEFGVIEVLGMLMIGVGLCLLSLIGWMASRRSVAQPEWGSIRSPHSKRLRNLVMTGQSHSRYAFRHR